MQTKNTDTNQNGNGQRWNDELDAYAQLLNASEDLDLATNFGHGNYNEDIFYQQISNYRRAAKAMELFGRIILERAIYETKVKLARDGITFYDDDEMQMAEYDPADVDEEHRRRDLRKRGEEIWQKMGDANRTLSDKQVNAVVRKTGHDLDWQSFYAKVLVFYHESSRSVNAELIRDFLTGIKHLRNDGDSEVAEALLGGGN